MQCQGFDLNDNQCNNQATVGDLCNKCWQLLESETEYAEEE